MLDNLYIAWKYVQFNKIKTATLVGCITLLVFLPLSLELLLNESEKQLVSRASSTPLVVGFKGSSLDLLMNTLYFGDEVPEQMTMSAVERIEDSDLAYPIPMYIRFKARGYPIVGTTLDYFDFRNLTMREGSSLVTLGECVLGAMAAERLNLKPGDSLVSSPENLFDLAGVYPLKMTVTGVLEKSHTPDDIAVFVDLKTAWVIQGLMHGHQDVINTADKTVILSQSDKEVTANAKLFHYAEITDENRDQFHFHGDHSTYPITAVIALPHDSKSGTILRGRYMDKNEPHQIVVPENVIDGLLQNIFRIKNVLDAVIIVVGLATVFAIVLVFVLSLRLRQREINTIFKLGCSRMTVAKLLGSEIIIIGLVSTVVSIALLTVIGVYANDLVRVFVIG